MAKSFWSRRKDTMSTAGGYIKATDAVSRPTALIMTILGIIVIGGLFFGVFWGARWSFEKLSNGGDKPAPVATNNTSGTSNSGATTPTPSPSVTATSSTSTTTPSTPKPASTPSTVPATTNNLPHTGPGSTTAFFFAVMLISYLAYRRKQLQS